MVADYVGIPYQVKIPSSRAEFREWQQTNGADVFIDSRLPSEDWLETHECAGTVSYVTMKLAMVTRRDFDGTIHSGNVYNVALWIEQDGKLLARNEYHDVFYMPEHTPGHPVHMSHETGCRIYWA